LTRRYTFGRFEVRPDERQLLVDGQPAALGARALDLLFCLVERRDRVVTKEELLQLVWPGMVVEENNLTVQISALRKLLGSQALATVSGRGYRFTLSPSEPGAAPPPAERPAADSSGAAEPQLPLPEKPSIAVLPFANLSDQAEQEYFTDGVTEDIITELSRFHSLFVIARNSSFTYKGKHVDVRTVARELGVRYVLEGSIRRAGNRIRVTAQLVDALDGHHIWAEKYDRQVEEVFALQEELTQAIVVAIVPQIDAAEMQKVRRRRPENLGAYELAMRANADAWDAWQTSNFDLQERSLAEAMRALALDPCSGVALTVIARVRAEQLFIHPSGPDANSQWNEALSAVTKAIELDPLNHQGHGWMAFLLSLGGRGPEALAHARRACELNPNAADALSNLAYVELMDGQHELALEHANRLARLSPRDPRNYITNAMRASACFFLRDHSKGLEYALLSVGQAPNWPPAHTNHVITAVGAGDLAGAKSALDAARRLAPEYVQRRLEGEWAFQRLEDRQRITLAYRIAAGLEDPAAAESLR